MVRHLFPACVLVMFRAADELESREHMKFFVHMVIADVLHSTFDGRTVGFVYR